MRGRYLDEYKEPITNVYFLGMYGANVVKIGVAQDVHARKQDIQVCNPFGLYVAAVIPGAGYKIERYFHNKYAEYRIRGEWFHVVQGMIDYLDTYPNAWLGWRHPNPYLKSDMACAEPA